MSVFTAPTNQQQQQTIPLHEETFLIHRKEIFIYDRFRISIFVVSSFIGTRAIWATEWRRSVWMKKKVIDFDIYWEKVIN